MSKGLEDLKWLIESGYIEEHGWQEDVEMLDCVNNIEKELKAFEIIQREPSDVIETITTYDTWEEYVKDYPIRDKTIWHIIKNKEEFDLLKEVLL